VYFNAGGRLGGVGGMWISELCPESSTIEERSEADDVALMDIAMEPGRHAIGVEASRLLLVDTKRGCWKPAEEEDREVVGLNCSLDEVL
jgi:hypothetical protein